MNKNEFLFKLRDYLEDYDVVKQNIDEIIEDYEGIIEEAKENGEDEDSIVTRLGYPKEIARSLRSHEKRVKKQDNSKYIALSPFVATIIYFILGFQYDAWHPGWLVFLIIPVAGVVFAGGMNLRTLLTALSPFFATLVYLYLGFMENIWHPSWIIFFIIPAFGVLNEKNISKRIGGFFLFTGFPLLYLYLELIDFSSYNWVVFVVMGIIGFFMGYVQLGININDEKQSREVKVFLLLIAVAYVLMGYFFSLWHPGWLIFLLVPVYFMRKEDKNNKIPFVAYSPFIAVALFILIGEFYSYSMSWLVFFIIPIAGVLEGTKN
jgi:hypothetical protein